MTKKDAMRAAVEALERAEPDYATSANTQSVREGFEIGGYIRHYKIAPHVLHEALSLLRAALEEGEEQARDLHAAIMNIRLPDGWKNDLNEMEKLAYKVGHRDARHAAAELALASPTADKDAK